MGLDHGDHRRGTADQLTGNRALTGFTAPKIIWVREHEPDVYAKIAHILLPKDYIRFKLTGDYHTDKADAAGMALLDVANREWSRWCSELGIPGGCPNTRGPEITVL
jgi:xylulokinase